MAGFSIPWCGMPLHGYDWTTPASCLVMLWRVRFQRETRVFSSSSCSYLSSTGRGLSNQRTYANERIDAIRLHDGSLVKDLSIQGIRRRAVKGLHQYERQTQDNYCQHLGYAMPLKVN